MSVVGPSERNGLLHPEGRKMVPLQPVRVTYRSQVLRVVPWAMPDAGPFGYVSMLKAKPRRTTFQRPGRSLRLGVVACGSLGLPRAAYQPQRIRNSATSAFGASA